jgi:hypothetical protein
MTKENELSDSAHYWLDSLSKRDKGIIEKIGGKVAIDQSRVERYKRTRKQRWDRSSALGTGVFNYDEVKDWHWFRINFEHAACSPSDEDKNLDLLYRLSHSINSYFNCMPLELPCLVQGTVLKQLATSVIAQKDAGVEGVFYIGSRLDFNRA